MYHRGPLLRDLTHDAAPLGRTAASPQHGSRETKHTFRAPEVMNITGSNGIHIGPINHITLPSGGQPQPGAMDPRPEREAVMQMLQVTREVSERDKSVVSQHLGDLWRQLGREMGYSSGQLDNIDSDYRRLQDKVYELLTLWHDRESGAATFDQLTRLLMRVRAFEVVKKLREAVL